MKNLEKCVARLIRPSRTRCARSRRLNLSLIGGRRPALPPHPLSNCAAPGAAPGAAPMSLPRSTKLQIWRLVFLTRVELWFGCCRARSQLSKKYFFTFELVRSGENERRECLWAVWVRRRVSAMRFGGIFGSFWGL